MGVRGRVRQTDERTKKVLGRIPPLLGIVPGPVSSSQSFHWEHCPRFAVCLSAAGILGWPGMDCRWCQAYEMTKHLHKDIAEEYRWRNVRLYRREDGVE